MPKKYSVVLFSLLLTLFCQLSQAQNKVVVIPLIGDDGPQYKGAWQVGQSYKESDVVEDGGSSFIAIVSHTSELANIPPDENFWGLVAASGANGLNGQNGIDGADGNDGSDGADGLNGLNCWDTNGNGIADLASEDVDQNGKVNAADCQGAQGIQGNVGEQGIEGPTGPAGASGAVGATGPTRFDACKSINGNSGVILNGVCLLDFDNTQTTNWAAATTACANLGGDLCSTSQYAQLRNDKSAFANDLFANDRTVWSKDFSDNDGGSKTDFLNSSDNPLQSQLASYACCGTLHPEPFRSAAQTLQGIQVSWVHTATDTSFVAAGGICTSLGADLCSKSQYSALQAGGVLSSALWSQEMSDNDAGLFDGVIGANATDNPSLNLLYGFACCASSLPLDYSCPNGSLQGNTGICVTETNTAEDTNFIDAAAACALQSSDICSKSQTTVIRSLTPALQSVKLWTNDGADNDQGRSGGLLSTQVDNPNPDTTQMGYVCCR